jgi:hypothetical protein
MITPREGAYIPTARPAAVPVPMRVLSAFIPVDTPMAAETAYGRMCPIKRVMTTT